jgi:hypothetical protein
MLVTDGILLLPLRLRLPAAAAVVAQAYISTGEGVKAVVTEAQLVGVLDAIKPALKHKR